MNEKPRLKPTDKICPLAFNPDLLLGEGEKCIGDRCALFVRMWKPKVLTSGKESYADPEFYQVFEGCGLIQQVPWAQQEYKKKSTSKKTAREESREEVQP